MLTNVVLRRETKSVYVFRGIDIHKSLLGPLVLDHSGGGILLRYGEYWLKWLQLRRLGPLRSCGFCPWKFIDFIFSWVYDRLAARTNR